jgi:hypothetical protein
MFHNLKAARRYTIEMHFPEKKICVRAFPAVLRL